MNKEKSNAGSVLDQLQSLEKKIDILLRLAYKMSDQAYKDLSISEKEMLTFNEATEYLGISPSLLYKMTASWTIPHYKPRGKMIYFSKKELEQFMKEGKIEASTSIYMRKDNEEQKET